MSVMYLAISKKHCCAIIMIAKNKVNAKFIVTYVANEYDIDMGGYELQVLENDMSWNEGYYNTITFSSDMPYFQVLTCPYVDLNVRKLKLEEVLDNNDL